MLDLNDEIDDIAELQDCRCKKKAFPDISFNQYLFFLKDVDFTEFKGITHWSMLKIRKVILDQFFCEEIFLKITLGIQIV